MRKILIAIVAVVASGCCRLPRPETGPSSSEELLAAVRARSLELSTVRGELRVDARGPEGRVAGRAYAFAASGGRLRLEAVSPMDTPIRTVAVDGLGGTFTMTDQEEGRCLEGPADPCLIGEAVGVELSAADVAVTLAGSAPLLRHGEAAARWDPCGHWELTLTGEERGWAEVLRLAPRDGEVVVVAAEVRGPEGLVLSVEHTDHRRVGEMMVPRRSRIRTPSTGGDLTVDWRTTETGVDLPDSAWRARCPDGLAVEAAICSATGSLPGFEDLTPPAPSGAGGDELPGAEGDEPPQDDGDQPPGGDLSEELGL